ncbi:hypothetical protein SBA5_220101 [Candidatus Sulfotelmatomonas gaucii]|uniref:Uncharacterized protein n=1 Tax=Candidatus Sulfuritelmatomonas gaucii TaxID=2043161 RepID=A0A2N9L8F0_9BACT|nr:hypothetical protein SBA5_220101 [Candidatus Sulfotelmatomonas gaucii]
MNDPPLEKQTMPVTIVAESTGKSLFSGGQ